jgi:TRAP-type C4-dicarboxylate transport system substrate-binding protein
VSRLALVALVLVCCGCGADRTGRAKHPVVLTLGAPASTVELETYAQTVARLSSGELRIRLDTRRHGGVPESEHELIGEVRAGRVDLGAAGSRAWDVEGAPSFTALNAPLLIDSIELEGYVLRTGITAPMLRSLPPLGLTGIGIVPGPLRRPFSVRRPLVRPADYRGLRIGTFESRTAEAMMRTLGATPVDLPFGAPLADLDGVEAPVNTVQGNRYDARGGYLTANVALSARPLVLFAGSRRFASLTAAQRTILIRAVSAGVSSELADERRSESDDAATLCRRGHVRLVDGNVAALRRAVAPVYARLERNAATRAAVMAIEALKRRSALPADTVPACDTSASPPSAGPTPFDGVYRMVTTLKHDSKGDPDPVPENYGTWIFVFARGRFAITQQLGPACTWGYGTYSVVNDIVEWRFTDGGGIAPNNAYNRPGEDHFFRWNRYRDTMTLRALPGASSPTNFFLQPWRRIASAPTRRYFATRCPPPAQALPK